MKARHHALLACALAGLAGAAGAQSTAACLAPGAWYTVESSSPRIAAPEMLLRSVAQREIVLLGEQHDNPMHHAWQLETLAALHLFRPQMVIGFESFPRRVQPVLDRWIAGKLTPREFLEQSEWQKVWNFPPELYLPLFEFARLNRIPMIALNVDRALTEAVNARGWNAVPAELKEGLSRPAAPSREYEDLLFEVFKEHARDKTRADPAFRRFVESQTTWDRAMAEALAARRRPSDPSAPLLIGIMGRGHVDGGLGVPHQLRDLGAHDVATLVPVDAQADCGKLRSGMADALFAAPVVPREPAPPPRLGVQLAMAQSGGVEITAVTAGSLAERSGLQHGDRIVALAGAPVSGAGAVATAVRAQPPGTWLPMQVRRGPETLDIVIRFPPRP